MEVVGEEPASAALTPSAKIRSDENDLLAISHVQFQSRQ
jgi:hypothetical protein